MDNERTLICKSEIFYLENGVDSEDLIWLGEVIEVKVCGGVTLLYLLNEELNSDHE